jgi:processive 1,2-diacylglycerol beta-glucosyltransferase
MSLLGSWSAGAGVRLFHRLVAVPGLYDGLHFAYLRAGSRLAERMDRASNAKLVPALRAELERRPADLIVSVFATGASAAAGLKAGMPGLRAVVLCTDVAVHRIWAAEGTDLFLVTSAAAAVGAPVFAPGAGGGGAAAGAVGVLRCPAPAAGQGGARDLGGWFHGVDDR